MTFASLKASTFRAASLVTLGFLLAACGTTKESPVKPQAQGGTYKVGKPYQINGVWYYPHEDYSYDETGIASWYGDDFHNKMTSNGEIFNKNELTAAHATLPLPSLARVTNLENGRSIVVRINDRGPFSGARIIDVTQRAAQLLGFEQSGTAKVRVQVLADESKAIADAMRRYGGPANAQGQPLPEQEATALASSAPVSAVTSQTLEPPPGAKASTAPLTSAHTAPHPLQMADAQQAPPLQLPQTRKEARAMMATVKPVPEAKQLVVSGANQIFVQAGAFTKQENAAKLRHTLSKYGRTSIIEATVNGTRYYRVRVGPSASVADADKLLKQVKKAGAEGARIVVD